MSYDSVYDNFLNVILHFPYLFMPLTNILLWLALSTPSTTLNNTNARHSGVGNTMKGEEQRKLPQVHSIFKVISFEPLKALLEEESSSDIKWLLLFVMLQ